jgi:streptogramin lyase
VNGFQVVHVELTAASLNPLILYGTSVDPGSEVPFCWTGTVWEPMPIKLTVAQARRLGSLQWFPLPQILTGTAPVGACFDGTYIWVAAETSDNITKIDARSGIVIGAYATGLFGTQYPCYDQRGSIWCSEPASNKVVKMNATTGAVTGSYAVGNSPNGTACSGDHIWSVSNSAATVTKLLTVDGSFVATVAVQNGSRGICFDGVNLWVCNAVSNSVSKIVAATNAVTNIDISGSGTFPYAVCFQPTVPYVPGKGKVWVTCAATPNVITLDTVSNAITGVFTSGVTPNAICYDGTWIWMTNQTPATVTQLLAATGAVVKIHTPGGVRPQSVCSDGTQVWVTFGTSNWVTRIVPKYV